MIETNFFNSLPAGDNAQVLLRNFRKLLLNNIYEYLRAINSSEIGLDISFLIKKYFEIDSSKNFSPSLYAHFSNLVNVSALGNVPAIIDSLHYLSILSEEEIYDSRFKISTILTENWERDFVNKIRIDTIPSNNLKQTIILPFINRNFSSVIKVHEDVSRQIQEIDSDFYKEVREYVSRIKLFNGKGLTATTSSSVFGAIYLCLPKERENLQVYLLEHIIHETSHLQLEILFAFDKIVLNDESEKFKSPLRSDPRPMLGIFHATFVLARMVRIFKRITTQCYTKEHQQRLEVFQKQFNEALEVVMKYANLTSNGVSILHSFSKTAEI